MHSHAEGGFLIPEMLNEMSRFSTPRSSVGDGISTDCDADVESNMSGNSEETSPHRRRSSHGIYGIVPASRSQIFLKKMEENQKSKETGEKIKSAMKNVLTNGKLLIFSSMAFIVLLIFLLVFLYSSCLGKCDKTGLASEGKNMTKSKWPVQFQGVAPLTKMLLLDVDHDNESDVIMAFKHNTSSQSGLSGNASFVVAMDGKTGAAIRKFKLDFLPFAIYSDPLDKKNASCFLISEYGVAVRISLTVLDVSWKIWPCSKTFSAMVIEDIDNDLISDLLLVCSWVSLADTTISGIVLVSGVDGSLIGSKIRYQLGQMPSPFLMQHRNAKNDTCILFGIQRRGTSTVLAVRLKRLMEIATGTRSKVNLVSENPLVVARNVRSDLEPVYEDISGDGVKDIGLVLEHGIISFIDGGTLSVRKTINVRSGHITSISLLPGERFGRSLFAVLKTSQGECKSSSLIIYGILNALDPYTINLPQIPGMFTEATISNKKQFIFWFPDKQRKCSNDKVFNDAKKESELQKTMPLTQINEKSGGGASIEDIDDSFDIETIDKNVLDNLREYVGIDDKGVTRHHKLFHLVCNYLLLRFLISYGITTESVLKDFKTTRSHLLSLSNRNLGKALTDQLKELLVNDYDKEINIPPWFDDIENDIDWLKNLGGKGRYKAKRDTYSLSDTDHDIPYVKSISFDENESGENARDWGMVVPESLRMMLINKEEIESEKKLASNTENVFEEGERQGKENNGENQHSETEETPLEKFQSQLEIPCYLPNPTFKSVLIDKMAYKWLDIAATNGETGNKKVQSSEEQGTKEAERNCSGVVMKVTEMQVHKDYLYYVVVYESGFLKTDILTQINRVKFKRGS